MSSLLKATQWGDREGNSHSFKKIIWFFSSSKLDNTLIELIEETMFWYNIDAALREQWHYKKLQYGKNKHKEIFSP